ncbi:MAG TPA: TIM-barrel domain-containing protein, partial [Candidatus Koribacter sp.]
MIRTLSRRFLFLSLTLLIALATAAQTSPITSAELNKNAALVHTGPLWLRLTAISPTAFRVEYSQSRKFSKHSSFAVLPAATTNGPNLQRHATKDGEAFSTGKISAVIGHTGILTFIDASGYVISSDKPGFSVQFHGPAFRVYKSMPIDEHYFGLGDKADAIDHRSQAFTMWNTDAYGWVGGSDPLYKSIPFFLALRQGKSYGIYLDNTYRTSFDFGKEASDMYSYGSTGGALDYYFFYGPDPKSVISQYTALTGHTPLPPRWALGYQQSRYSYYPESRVYEIAKELREHHIPTDALYLDIDYLQGYRAFDINRRYFPTFEKMV